MKGAVEEVGLKGEGFMGEVAVEVHEVVLLSWGGSFAVDEGFEGGGEMDLEVIVHFAVVELWVREDWFQIGFFIRVVPG